MKMRERLAISCAKFVSKLIQKRNKGKGTTLPGYIARLIAPDVLAGLAGMVREKIIVTMGTNGKTTTNNLLCRALEAEGKKVVCNRVGANMENGIVSAFVLAAGRGGRLDADYACIEVDEFSAVHVLSKLKPDCILLTNFFRDQLDRYGEIDITCRKVKEAVSSVPEAVLVINGDDIFSYALARECKNHAAIYGISEQAFPEAVSEGLRESLFCRFCGKRLIYDFFHYGHLGSYHCPACGIGRPEPDYTAAGIQFDDKGCSFELDGKHITADTQAAYSIYNILSSYTALRTVKAPTGRFADVVQHFDYGNNREEAFSINGSHVQLYLMKNPIGFQQKIAMIQRDPKPKDIILLINDNAQDGKDISWLWDVDFSSFTRIQAASITTTGLRRYDMELRLKYDGIPCQSSSDIEETVKTLAQNGTKNMYIIVNYTGLYATNSMLNDLQDS